MRNYMLGFILALSIPLQPWAAEIELAQYILDENYGENCLKAKITLTGEIAEGDAERLRLVIETVDKFSQSKNSACYLNDSSGDRVAYVQLESNGGQYVEGWKIAKILSGMSVASYVGADSYCYSACAIAFLGGSVPGADGATLQRRVMHPTAKLGFHAPFPVLEDKSYDAETVRTFFLAAFAVSSDFMKEAKSMGITPEVAQILLQPTPDDFFEINTVGSALLTNVTVSSNQYPFSVYSDGKADLSGSDILNLCYNNHLIRQSGKISDLVGFLEYRSKEPPLFARTMRSSSRKDALPINVAVVPVADVGEGMIESCVATAMLSNGESTVPKGRMDFSCRGFSLGESDLADNLQNKGLGGLNFGDSGHCHTSVKTALLPWNTQIADIPTDYEGN